MATIYFISEHENNENNIIYNNIVDKKSRFCTNYSQALEYIQKEFNSIVETFPSKEKSVHSTPQKPSKRYLVELDLGYHCFETKDAENNQTIYELKLCSLKEHGWMFTDIKKRVKNVKKLVIHSIPNNLLLSTTISVETPVETPVEIPVEIPVETKAVETSSATELDPKDCYERNDFNLLTAANQTRIWNILDGSSAYYYFLHKLTKKNKVKIIHKTDTLLLNLVRVGGIIYTPEYIRYLWTSAGETVPEIVEIILRQDKELLDAEITESKKKLESIKITTSSIEKEEKEKAAKALQNDMEQTFNETIRKYLDEIDQAKDRDERIAISTKLFDFICVNKNVLNINNGTKYKLFKESVEKKLKDLYYNSEVKIFANHYMTLFEKSI